MRARAQARITALPFVRLRTNWERVGTAHCPALLSALWRLLLWSQTHRISGCTDGKTMTAAVPVFPLANLEQHVDALRKTCHEPLRDAITNKWVLFVGQSTLLEHFGHLLHSALQAWQKPGGRLLPYHSQWRASVRWSRPQRAGPTWPRATELKKYARVPARPLNPCRVIYAAAPRHRRGTCLGTGRPSLMLPYHRRRARRRRPARIPRTFARRSDRLRDSTF